MTQHEHFISVQKKIQTLGYILVLNNGHYTVCDTKYKALKRFNSLDKVVPYMTILKKCGPFDLS